MRPFQQVDVFSAQPLRGNPVAVVHDAEGLTTEQMERFTRWTNLSEATFLLPPTDPAADYRVRIFTAAGELPLRRPPHAGQLPRLAARRWRCRAIRRGSCRSARPGSSPSAASTAGSPSHAPPVRRSGPVEPADLQRIARILGIEPAVTSSTASGSTTAPAGWRSCWSRPRPCWRSSPSRAAASTSTSAWWACYPPDSECAYEVRAIFGDDRGDTHRGPGHRQPQRLAGAVAGRQRPRDAAVQRPARARCWAAAGRARISQDADGAIWVGGATRSPASRARVDIE